ncbi:MULTISPECIES: signal peptidase II [Turicibacter]|jgi:signal peptidase II|uniref:Lipoprotein signal peptidase n=3 Tax=Turicibacter sanguinis TaxID=154288 RepID=A0A173UH00_9FIRM|nr:MULTISPECIES: signal peptidase II [Turicibacter]EFF63200.1 signal peptidase II [Turicibacter sanguinis PC909]EGC91213.1 signal peptidase II [Turicibacter sp. HGF1]MBP3904392.1 signal peptidase II [Turicibacter sp.]MCU7192672.1 signal peptidase II [Turicibacter sanguinis]MCU7198285.1 signal peptidase II [Turicibacter sanguinis]
MWLIIAIVALTIVLDQVTKYLVASQMTIGQSIPIIDNFLYITSHRNAGAAWGIFQGKMMFFYLITLAVIAVVIVWMTRLDIKKDKWLMIALALILGGAVGNFIDRVLYQHVVDFIDTYILGYDFPIFNIADSALCIGVVLMAIDAILDMKRQ